MKNTIILILSLLVIGIGSYIIFDKFINKEVKESNAVEQKENTEKNDEINNNNNSITYKVFKKGEEIVLSDNSKWLVINDSDENTDYVTVLSEKDYSDYLAPTDGSYNSADFIVNNDNFEKILEYFNYKASIIPATLKEVDGYKIRLIKLEEIINYDNNWTYDDNTDSYNYSGELNNEFRNVLTMTHTKCSQGKCAPYYSTGCQQPIVDDGNPVKCFISHWQLGLGGLNPVINIYKTSIK